jgi:hypothetical protein
LLLQVESVCAGPSQTGCYHAKHNEHFGRVDPWTVLEGVTDTAAEEELLQLGKAQKRPRRR